MSVSCQTTASTSYLPSGTGVRLTSVSCMTNVSVGLKPESPVPLASQNLIRISDCVLKLLKTASNPGMESSRGRTLGKMESAGGFGGRNVYARSVIPVPYPKPAQDFTLLIGDWLKTSHKVLQQQYLDSGNLFPFLMAS
ncbi:hypothetical protein Vadar_002733 [Vaccinium darrowii]|uniref:Uncharacterized protein n=1 Tax=Vaccinium darrowii TaxID=229202 RepID=A0ACB7YUG5_9ERIC|nr:hypothetical protein Vadar_002733 [Vaccinium darrowii]